ncbi:MAG: DNA polymerase IV [Ruminococcaceae bacterium]|nr:DNA polymerase IV [Oscillospiraceae bacterium]
MPRTYALHSRVGASNSPVILHCDLNNFFASAEILDYPELRERPVAVGGSVEERHGIVLAKNYVAKRYGVSTGEALWQAKNKCPDLVVLRPHYEKYSKYSRLVRDVYERYTDKIEVLGIDECYLDVTGSRYLFGGGEEIAHKIREEVKRETGLTISVGVSFNKIFAKLGSDMKKPDAVTVIPRENFREIVWGLPASDMLGVGRKTAHKLWQRGIETIGDIARCPRELMHSYFGKSGITLWAYANGLENSPVTDVSYSCPVKSIGHGTTTTADLTSEAEVCDLIGELVEEIGAKLRREGMRCGGVAVGIRENDLSCREYQMKFKFSTQLTREIRRGAVEVFRQKHIWRNDIRSVTVRAIYLDSESSPEQVDMFRDTGKEGAVLALESTVDRLRERYGEHSVASGTYFAQTKLTSQRIGFSADMEWAK